MSTTPPRDFKESLLTTIQINRRHITPTDWQWICLGIDSQYHRGSAWKRVPQEDMEYLQQLVRDGCSFAYASILQSCARNNIAWIHFSDEHPFIRGLVVYNDAWSKPNPFSDTGETSGK